MRLHSPILSLIAVVALVLITLAWVSAQRRRVHATLRFSDPELLAAVTTSRLGWSRHIGTLTVLVAVVIAGVGAGQPEIKGPATSESARVVLVIDTSGSMNAFDITPTRLQAAKEAGYAFIDAAPPGVEIAIVSFASGAVPIQTPTADKAVVRAAIESLTADGGTAIGEGIYTGLGMLETDGWVGDPADQIQRRQGALVVLTDGEYNSGRDPLVAAETALTAGVVVNTVAFGTPDGTANGIAVGVDVTTMQQIAEITGGRYAQATTAEELASVFQDLGRTTREVYGWNSVAHWFAFAVVVVLMLGAAFGLRRTGRVP